MSKHRYTVETLQAGQSRAYADSIYHYRVTVEWQGLAGFKNKDAPFVLWKELNPAIVQLHIRGLVGNWEDKPEWHERTLTKFECVGPGVYEVIVKQAYDD